MTNQSYNSILIKTLFSLIENDCYAKDWVSFTVHI